jgi:hypothetical protein
MVRPAPAASVEVFMKRRRENGVFISRFLTENGYTKNDQFSEQTRDYSETWSFWQTALGFRTDALILSDDEQRRQTI